MSKSHSINRRKFLEIIGCSCSGYFLSGCGTVPITERKQLTLYPESVVNRQAAKAYENFKAKSKSKLITSGKELDNIVKIGEKIENAVTSFFKQKNQTDPTKNFDWEYILVDNKKIKNAWCMPGGKIAVYTGLLDITKNIKTEVIRVFLYVLTMFY
mgnify:CR=1 FL=1